MADINVSIVDDDAGYGDRDDNDQERFKKIKKNAGGMTHLHKMKRIKREPQVPLCNYSRAEQRNRMLVIPADIERSLLKILNTNKSLAWMKNIEKNAKLFKNTKYELKYYFKVLEKMEKTIKEGRARRSVILKSLLGNVDSGESQSNSDKDYDGQGQPIPPINAPHIDSTDSEMMYLIPEL